MHSCHPTPAGRLRTPFSGRRGMRGLIRCAALVVMILVIGQVTPAQDASPVPPGQTSKPSDQSSGSSQQASPSLFAPLRITREESPYTPITRRQRARWFITNTLGPPHLAGGLITSAFGTALDRPKEYGPHWGGFADRYGMRLTGIVTGNAIEVTAGYFIHEDPRYFRVPDRPFKSRVANVFRMTFMARHYDGSFGPAYGRYLAIPGNNFLSNSWRVSSEANTQDAIFRTGEGFAGRMAANAFEEFWPDAKRLLFHRHQ